MSSTNGTGKLRTFSIELSTANAIVKQWHRHHKPVRGYRWAVGAEVDGRVVGAAICGRPVARNTDPLVTLEVTRLVTNGTKNACSFLYATCARIAKELGYQRIQTFILSKEEGTTLKASGWVFDGWTAGGDWNRTTPKRGNRRTDQPLEPKQRWIKVLR